MGEDECPAIGERKGRGGGGREMVGGHECPAIGERIGRKREGRRRWGNMSVQR